MSIGVNHTGKPVGVLIVDDSALVRRVLARELEKQPGIRVLDTAPDPFVARDKIVALRPDVVTLDIEMPRMDGLSFLRRIMRFHPVPTIIVSSLTPRGCETAMACLEAGAIDVLDKPRGQFSVGDLAARLGDIIRAAPRILPRRAMTAVTAPARFTTALPATTHKVIVIGASTGGTEAIRAVLEPLPATAPGILMVQHMPAGFTRSFAERLDRLCAMEVREACDGDSVIPGVALLAPGERHMELNRDGARYIARLSDGPRVRRHRPSVDVLFRSAARHAGANAMGIMLTGMGDDGAEAMRLLHDAGARTIAQDEATSVVFGMPREAIRHGGVDIIAPLHEIAGRMVEFAAGRAASVGSTVK